MRTSTLLSILPLLASTALALPQPLRNSYDSPTEERRRLDDREHMVNYVTRYHTEWVPAQAQATGVTHAPEAAGVHAFGMNGGERQAFGQGAKGDGHAPGTGGESSGMGPFGGGFDEGDIPFGPMGGKDGDSPYGVAAAAGKGSFRGGNNQAAIGNSYIAPPNAANLASDSNTDGAMKPKKKNGKCKRPDHRHGMSPDTKGQGKASVPKVSPEPQPAGQDKPDPSPAPAPAPAPTGETPPAPVPAPAPTGETPPAPVPAPEPTSQTRPSPAPTPSPAPAVNDNVDKAPEPAPAPSPKPGPAGDNAAPEPSPAPEVLPQPEPVKDAPAPVNNADAGGSPGSPVGLAVNGRLAVDVGSFGGGLGWYYDWDVKPLPGYEALEFVPMLHGRKWVDEFTPEQLGGAKYALSFNEPNIAATPEAGGSGMSFQDAAELHKRWTAMAPADVKIGSISPSRGGSGFFKQWYDACGGESCRMDFVTFHFYGINIDQLKAEVEQYKGYGKPIWVTEVACREYREDSPNNWVLHHCSNEERDKLMSDMITYFNEEPQIERWAWFGSVSELVETNDENAIVDQGGKANDLGKLYASNKH